MRVLGEEGLLPLGITAIGAVRAPSSSSSQALYAATGGVDFIIQAWLLARRTHRVAEAT